MLHTSCTVEDTMNAARIQRCREASTSYVNLGSVRASSCLCNILGAASSLRAGQLCHVRARRSLQQESGNFAAKSWMLSTRGLGYSTTRNSRPTGRHRTITAASAAAAIQLTEEQIVREGLPTLPRPQALPPAPRSSSLLNVREKPSIQQEQYNSECFLEPASWLQTTKRLADGPHLQTCLR